MAWWFAAFGTFVALCSVPSLVGAELTRHREALQRPPAGWDGILRYHLGRVRIAGAGLIFLLWGGSYLYLIAEHVGLFERLARMEAP